MAGSSTDPTLKRALARAAQALDRDRDLQRAGGIALVVLLLFDAPEGASEPSPREAPVVVQPTAATPIPTPISPSGCLPTVAA